MKTALGRSKHQQRDWLRFGVYGANGLWGPTWKVWQVPDGVAIGGRAVGGRFAFERCQEGWAARFEAQEPGVACRAVHGCLRIDALPGGPVWAPGRTLLSITTPRQALTQRALPRRFRYIAQIPLHQGRANETHVVAFDAGDATGVLGGRSGYGWVLLASLELGAGLRVAVFYRSVSGATLQWPSRGISLTDSSDGVRDTRRAP